VRFIILRLELSVLHDSENESEVLIHFSESPGKNIPWILFNTLNYARQRRNFVAQALGSYPDHSLQNIHWTKLYFSVSTVLI